MLTSPAKDRHLQRHIEMISVLSHPTSAARKAPMLITLQANADAAAVKGALARLGLWVEQATDSLGHIQFRVLEGSAHADPHTIQSIASMEGVAAVWQSESAHPRVDAQTGAIDIAGFALSRANPAVIAGPCSVESEAQIEEIAAAAAAHSVPLIRGGAFKPRSSPYSFQGHGARALEWLRRAADRHGLRVVSEVLSENDVSITAELAHLLQIGSRNMQNFALLRAAGKTGKPVLLKRGAAATLEEWLLAGEHLLSNGCGGVAFCERGIRGFDPSTRNLLDLGAVALLSHVHGQAVLVDPSHGTGRKDILLPMAKAALAAGAAGVMVEVHPHPERALSDGPQALSAEEFSRFMRELSRFARPER